MERQGPIIKLSEKVWSFCVDVAQKHHLEPEQVFSRLVAAGYEVMKIEEHGGIVVGKDDEKLVKIVALKGVDDGPNSN
ncbi:MAG: hypothetical protein HYV90_00055 [Candidatus Woesebacteria bacterium]|nr:MAG: hypothetical protein HYV90_00055 [Candidatus Woesebacteria bacterium]